MKSRFTTTDVKVEVKDLSQKVMGERVANIYDVNDKTYLFKFAQSGSSEKHVLLIESGIRFHITKFDRDRSEMPSPFTMKLRKYLRTKRLEKVNQLGNDRVVDFTFGSGEATNHIIAEFYANGNIILTDFNYEIIALLRSHEFDENSAVKVGEIYPVVRAINLDDSFGVTKMNVDDFLGWCRQKDDEHNSYYEKSLASGKKEKVKKLTLKQVLLSKDSGISSFGVEIIDDCILSSGLKSSEKVVDLYSESKHGQVSKLLENLSFGSKIVEDFTHQTQPGFILFKTSSSSEENGSVNYFDFVPRLFLQHKDLPHLQFPSFDEAVDEYFSKIEDQKLQKQLNDAEIAAKKKIEKIKEDQQLLLKNLEDTQHRMEISAKLVEMNTSTIDKMSLVINSALVNGMDWDDIEDMVDVEKARGNPIAGIIHKLDLAKNIVIIRLKNVIDCIEESEEESDNESDEESEEESDEEHSSHKKVKTSNRNDKNNKTTKGVEEFLLINIDIRESAFGNAREMFTSKKIAKVKEEKTIQAAQKVVENVEDQTLRALESKRLKKNLTVVRKVHWFEKFNWFISSEGYLVLSGRDAQQNELLVKRYLRKGDVYVHADIAGAASCIVRAKASDSIGSGNKTITPNNTVNVISPLALQEAGIMTVCRSRAWASKVVTSAWWVHASQVSKTAPSGEYLVTGSFMIYGKKNFLPPMNLEMGFGIMFRLEDGSVARHLNDRQDKLSNFDDLSMFSEAVDRYGLDQSNGNCYLEGLTVSSKELVQHDISSEVSKSKAVQETIDDAVESIEGTWNDKVDPLEDYSPLDGGNENDSTIISTDDEIQITPAKTLSPDKKGSDAAATTTATTSTSNKNKALKTTNASTKSNDSKNNDSKTNSNMKGNSKAIEKEAPMSSSSAKKKALNKKKARRYAEQDDEDRELAMLALGHSTSSGKTLKESLEAEQINSKRLDTEKKKLKAGVHLLTSNGSIMTSSTSNDGSNAENINIDDPNRDFGLRFPIWNRFSLPVQNSFRQLFDSHLLSHGDLQSAEFHKLADFTEGECLDILRLFQEGCASKEISNRNSFLAGIMRRFNRNKEKKDPSVATMKKKEALENDRDVQQILEEEGILEEEEGKMADDLEKLTGCPVVEDTLLYAVPVCGPYSSMKDFKYKVKLTPGVMKKGKAAKQSIELFVRSKDCSASEKNLLRALNDPEMVAVLLGDIKISMPGLQQLQKQIGKKGKK